MRRFAFAVLILLISSAGASAQPPQEIKATDRIEMQPGEARVFQFEKSVNRLDLSSEGIVQAVPESDRVFSFRALKSGHVIMTAYAPDGALVHRSVISVGGRLVRIYGTESRRRGRTDSGKDYVGYNCTSLACGRADPDFVDAPLATAISETRQNPDGSTTTTTQQYR